MAANRRVSLGERFGTPERRVLLGVLAWLLLLALGSAFVSMPFRVQTSAGAAIQSGNAMYLDGLLIGMVGFLSLLAVDVFAAAEGRGILRPVIFWGAIGATLLSGLGGIFNRVLGHTFPLAVEVAAFILLDAVLLSLTIALFLHTAQARRVWTWTAAIAALGALLAAAMGSVAAWMNAFGDWPKGLIGGYATLAGIPWQQWLSYITTAAAQEMVAAVIALVVATYCAAFGGQRPGSRLTRLGLWLAAAGTVAATLIYLVSGFSVAQPPILFQHGPDLVNGVGGGDLVISAGVLLGGTLALIGLGVERLADAGHRWGAALVAAMLLLTLAGFGSYIQINESLYGMGAVAAPRAAADAAFTWFHQDFAWLLLPAVLTVLVALRRLSVDRVLERRAVGALAAGSAVAFVGGALYTFVSPSPTGVSFAVTTIGFAAIVLGVVLGLWSAVPGPHAQERVAAGAGWPGLPAQRGG